MPAWIEYGRNFYQQYQILTRHARLTNSSFCDTFSCMELFKRAAKNIAERLCWHTACRDQQGIAKDLAEGKDISEVYGLGEAGLFDEFFYFLDQLNIMKLLLKLEPTAWMRSSNIKFPSVILIYLMRIVAGLSFFWHIHPVLLRSQALMRLVGFNGVQIREGTCERGKHKRKTNGDETHKDSDIRGPICPDSIATYIQSITASALEGLFNGVVSILAAHGFFPRKVHALLDSSDIESTERCEGCGRVKKQKAPELRRRKARIRKVMEIVFGFKVWIVWDPNSRLPLAMRFATIETPDIQFAWEVLQQAAANLGDHAKIVTVAIDRAFIDGTFLWRLNKDMEVTFYIPAKTNMQVYLDALALVSEGHIDSRERKRNVGAGKNKHTVIDRWEVAGIEGLTSAGFYGELGSGSHENRKDFVANPINAVVVLQDPYKDNNPNTDTLVILTNGSVQKPIKVYDGYDARSEIENAVFREAKQAWFIKRPARNNAEAFRSHVYLTLITMALVTAFQTWMNKQEQMDQEDAKPESENSEKRSSRKTEINSSCSMTTATPSSRPTKCSSYAVQMCKNPKVTLKRSRKTISCPNTASSGNNTFRPAINPTIRFLLSRRITTRVHRTPTGPSVSKVTQKLFLFLYFRIPFLSQLTIPPYSPPILNLPHALWMPYSPLFLTSTKVSSPYIKYPVLQKIS